MLLPADPVRELASAVALLGFIVLVLEVTKRFYKLMVESGLKHNVAVYYNRKVIHMLGGGVTALLVPHLFTSPLIPLAFALGLAAALYLPHKRKKVMNWFQTDDNNYEVNFCLAWGLSLLVLWLATGSPYYAVVPALFISFGDAVTGLIRNALYGKRTKSWVGNLGMLVVVSVIGFYYAGYPGLFAGLLSSLVERIEVAPLLDDNVLITAVASAVILVLRPLGY